MQCSCHTYRLVSSLQLPDTIAPLDGRASSIKTGNTGHFSKLEACVEAADATVVVGSAEGAITGTDAVGHIEACMVIRKLDEVSDLNGHDRTLACK